MKEIPKAAAAGVVVERIVEDIVVLGWRKVGSKRKRVCSPDDIARGAARAHQFLQGFSALPLDQMDLNQAIEQVNKLRSELEKDAASYPWLQQFF